jgi:hypothetical protein
MRCYNWYQSSSIQYRTLPWVIKIKSQEIQSLWSLDCLRLSLINSVSCMGITVENRSEPRMSSSENAVEARNSEVGMSKDP